MGWEPDYPLIAGLTALVLAITGLVVQSITLLTTWRAGMRAVEVVETISQRHARELADAERRGWQAGWAARDDRDRVPPGPDAGGNG